MDAELERVTDPAYLENLGTRELPEVRAMRAECQQLESSLSYARRIVQGRLDIVTAEAERRRSGGASGDLAGLIEQLPTILGARVAGGGSPRPPQALEPATERFLARADAVLKPEEAVSPTDLDAAQLDAARDGFVELEHELSEHRHRLHQVIDALHAEIARRYSSGEANVDSLLQ